MQNLEIIQRSIDYIEEHIQTELTAIDLANDAGFSLFHYYRIFQGVVGVPVMQYIIKRKLTHAIYEISKGNKVIDIALRYGFLTHAGFYKAFIREYGCPPTQYLKKNKAIKPYKLNLQKEIIMISEKKLKEVLSHWDLSEPYEIKNYDYETSGNKANHTWVVNDSFNIKVTTNLMGLKNQIAVSKSLAKAGVYVSLAIPTKENSDFYTEGDLHFCLSNRLEGDCLKSSDFYQDVSFYKSRYLGEIIGQLHLILKNNDQEVICNEPNLLNTLTDWAIPEVRKYMTFPNEFYEDYLETFQKLYNSLPKHIIHRDPNPGNIIMNNGQLVGFIDFELTERNIRIFDPCYASTAILSESFVKKDEEKLITWITIYKNIIDGYDQICKLSSEETQAVPYVILAIQLICVAYFSNKEKYQELARVNQSMLYWLYQHKDLLKLS